MAFAGVDLWRGRPTPAVGTTEAKLQQRKLDALKRGIHRIANIQALPYSVHMIGVGGAGGRIVRRILQDAPDDLVAVAGSRLSALAIDVGNQDVGGLPELAEKFPADRAQIETLALEVPDATALHATLQRYGEFLTLESPLYRWNNRNQPWLDEEAVLPKAGAPMPRAVAKAIYGQAYYDRGKPAAKALRRFAASVDATPGDAVVCIIFGLGGGSGSGIAIDLARHLSNHILGRRVLVTGIGILPCLGDAPAQRGARLFPVLNELDCMGDESKNRGVVMSCGDLYRNPFTAGFIAVPQQHVWDATKNLAETHVRVDREVASLLTARHGANLWEMLRLLNWVAAPSTQHSAARTPWGAKWLHMLGFADAAGSPLGIDQTLPERLGLLPGYRPEFIEANVPDDADQAALGDALNAVFLPDIPPQMRGGNVEGSVQFILPRIAKTELSLFAPARDAYDETPNDQKVLDHSLLLDQGIQLSEPSEQLAGMAGASLPGSAGWVAVPLAELRGETDAA